MPQYVTQDHYTAGYDMENRILPLRWQSDLLKILIMQL